MLVRAYDHDEEWVHLELDRYAISMRDLEGTEACGREGGGKGRSFCASCRRDVTGHRASLGLGTMKSEVSTRHGRR